MTVTTISQSYNEDQQLIMAHKHFTCAIKETIETVKIKTIHN